MINLYEVKETNQMIEQDNLDVRTITLGISLMDCIDADLERLNQKIYDIQHFIMLILLVVVQHLMLGQDMTHSLI